MTGVSYVAVRFVAMVFQMFPIDLNLQTARWMGWVWYRVMRRHRQRAREHLRLAYGDTLTDKQIDEYALKSMQQMTMMAIEVLFTPRLINEWTWPRYIRLKGIEQALDVLVSRRGAILVTGHYGSWELVGFHARNAGLPVDGGDAAAGQSYLNAHLMPPGPSGGCGCCTRKGPRRVRPISWKAVGCWASSPTRTPATRGCSWISSA